MDDLHFYMMIDPREESIEREHSDIRTRYIYTKRKDGNVPNGSANLFLLKR